jgi:hypothetical protein
MSANRETCWNTDTETGYGCKRAWGHEGRCDFTLRPTGPGTLSVGEGFWLALLPLTDPPTLSVWVRPDATRPRDHTLYVWGLSDVEEYGGLAYRTLGRRLDEWLAEYPGVTFVPDRDRTKDEPALAPETPPQYEATTTKYNGATTHCYLGAGHSGDRDDGCITREDEKPDPVSPDYYRAAGVECVDVIDALGFNYNVGTAFAYLWRLDRKGGPADAVLDIEKAVACPTEMVAIYAPYPARLRRATSRWRAKLDWYMQVLRIEQNIACWERELAEPGANGVVFGTTKDGVFTPYDPAEMLALWKQRLADLGPEPA